jgi:UDP-glucose 4-epimerase
MCRIWPVGTYWRFSTFSGAETRSPFNPANGLGVSVRGVIDTARAATGCKIATRDVAKRPGDSSILVADPTRACELLGWSAERLDLATIISDAWR